MTKTIFGGKRLAVTGALMLCLGLALALTMVKRSEAFTLIELQFKFNPTEITSDQTAHVVFNNTFGEQEVHVQINWGDAITGTAIGLPFVENVAPGHGAVIQLPAVQSTGGTRAIIVVCKLTPAPGFTSLPSDIGARIGATLEVVDRATGHVLVANGLATAPTALKN
jgi:hypothetical protein